MGWPVSIQVTPVQTTNYQTMWTMWAGEQWPAKLQNVVLLDFTHSGYAISANIRINLIWTICIWLHFFMKTWKCMAKFTCFNCKQKGWSRSLRVFNRKSHLFYKSFFFLCNHMPFLASTLNIYTSVSLQWHCKRHISTISSDWFSALTAWLMSDNSMKTNYVQEQLRAE